MLIALTVKAAFYIINYQREKQNTAFDWELYPLKTCTNTISFRPPYKNRNKRKMIFLKEVFFVHFHSFFNENLRNSTVVKNI